MADVGQIGSTFVQGIAQNQDGLEPSNTVSKDSFSEALLRAETAVLEPQQDAQLATENFLRGDGAGMHETLIAMSKADISLRFFVNVRNRVLEAYREVMRMGS